MTPHESLQYLAQVCSDYGRTLPPSLALPFQQVAQDALNVLAVIVSPPPMDAPAPEREPLRAVPPPRDAPEQAV